MVKKYKNVSVSVLMTLYVFCAILFPALHSGGLLCPHSGEKCGQHELFFSATFTEHEDLLDDELCQLCMIASIPQDTSIAHEYSPANNKIDIALVTFTDLTIPKNKIKANPSTAPPFFLA